MLVLLALNLNVDNHLTAVFESSWRKLAFILVCRMAAKVVIPIATPVVVTN